MPANIAHMLIAHKVMNKISEKGVPEYSDFVDKLNQARSYLNLGSMGPDLFYYGSLAKGVKGMIVDGFVSATGVEPWSYHLHGARPNEFPLNLIKITFRDTIRDDNGHIEFEFQDFARLAFIAGYLTHVAADQIIHPVVNEIAGPYYREGKNRSKHRESEVFQDCFLYHSVYKLEGKTGKDYEFTEQDFDKWADCITGFTTDNTKDWFRYFIQRGFAETYNFFPEEDMIENSVDNLLLALRLSTKAGPYRKADDEWKEKGEDSARYKEFISDVDYLKHYRIAIELGVVYVLAFYEAYKLLSENRDFSNRFEERFLKIVNDSDLTTPLEKNILDKAEKAFRKTDIIDPNLDTIKEIVENVSIEKSEDILTIDSLEEVVKM